MTLSCVMFDSDLRKKLGVSKVVKSFNDALHFFSDNCKSLLDAGTGGDCNPIPYVMRCYNSACSFWVGFDNNGSFLVENSRAEFKRSRDLFGGVSM